MTEMATRRINVSDEQAKIQKKAKRTAVALLMAGALATGVIGATALTSTFHQSTTPQHGMTAEMVHATDF